MNILQYLIELENITKYTSLKLLILDTNLVLE